jgi:hypothetical protein
VQPNANAAQAQQNTSNAMNVSGENFTRDLMVWFGDKSAKTEFRSKELLTVSLPQELMYGTVANASPTPRIVNGRLEPQDARQRPILLSRSDGVIFKTGKVWC